MAARRDGQTSPLRNEAPKRERLSQPDGLKRRMLRSRKPASRREPQKRNRLKRNGVRSGSGSSSRKLPITRLRRLLCKKPCPFTGHLDLRSSTEASAPLDQVVIDG